MKARAFSLGMRLLEFYFIPLGELSDLIDAHLILENGYDERIEFDSFPTFLK